MTSISAMHSIPTGVPANGNVPANGAVVPASASEVTAMLGEVDPMVVARVLATNASVDEIAEAVRGNDDGGELSFLPASSSRVAEVRSILDEADVFGDDIFEEELAFSDDGYDY
ncbi:MAG TPA: hypothetical protein VL326_28800 [Kofleriaceae bacterium]|jgi:hypothetical protein|nr:hypothetical protein [Kofleriaceae bacterium]